MIVILFGVIIEIQCLHQYTLLMLVHLLLFSAIYFTAIVLTIT